jgi:thiol:disulfide interchange protein DsbD
MKRIVALCLTLACATGVARAATEEDLLEPDKAFALTTRVVDVRTLEANWKIAPGYYLYRDKFRFELVSGDAVLGVAQIPPGKKKDDPLFGKVETYVKAVAVRLPLERRADTAQTLKLRITAQGCNEPIGVCYPPIVKEVGFALPATAAAAAGPARTEGGGNLAGLRSLKDLARDIGGGAPDEPVDPEKAFVVSVARAGDAALAVRFDVADCCYLYRDKTRVELVPPSGGALPDDVRLGDYKLPAGKAKTDEFLGKTEVYTAPFELKVPVAGLARATGAALKVSYQGCSEKGVAICYPPTSKTFSLGDVIATASAAEPRAGAPVKTDNGKFLVYVLGAFGIGLLLTFTPCVLPMIPILSSVIVGSAADRRITKLEGGMLSTAYVLGTAVTYTAAGVLAGATGEQLQAYFQHPLALMSFATLFVALALSMFGFYELQMPSFVQSHLHHHSHHVHSRFKHLKGGALIGLFVMGLLSALVVGACVSPLFISALGVAIANRDPVLGGAIMFAMALGMGVILIAIGVGAGFLMPKAGAWMERVKHVFGVLLLAVAIYLLGFIPQVPVLLLWAALLVIVGVYLGATQSLPAGAGGWQYLWKGIGTVSLIWGVAALLGGFAGNREILSPLPALGGGATVAVGGSPGAGSAAEAPLFERVKTLATLESRLAQAQAARKPALLDYYADWCTDCLRMEKATFRDPGVRAELEKRFVLLQADVTDPNDPEVKAMKQRFGVFGPPAMLFFASSGEEQRELRSYGFRSVEEFLGLLRRI